MTEELVKNLVGTLIGVFTLINTRILWDIRDSAKKHEQTLYGANGNNGVISEIKSLRKRTHQHATMLTEHALKLGTSGHGALDDDGTSE